MTTTICTEQSARKVMIIISDENVLQQIQSTINPSAFQAIILDAGNTVRIEQTEPSVRFRVLKLKTFCFRYCFQPVEQKQTRKKSLICVVCGAGAHGRNFGVIACESCKLFFRRNGLRDPVCRFCV